MRTFSDPLSYRNLWSLRWALGATVLSELLVGAGGITLFTYQQPFLKFWTGAALATLPGYAIGILLQRRFDPIPMKERRATVWILWALSAMLFVAVVRFAIYGWHAR
jgi:hypothetical protein